MASRHCDAAARRPQRGSVRLEARRHAEVALLAPGRVKERALEHPVVVPLDKRAGRGPGAGGRQIVAVRTVAALPEIEDDEVVQREIQIVVIAAAPLPKKGGRGLRRPACTF